MMPAVMFKPSRLLARLREDRRGTSVLELALMTPIGIGLIVAVTDISMAYVSQLALEQSAQRAIEMVTAKGEKATDYSFVENEAESMDNVSSANVTSWLECNNIKQDVATTCPTGETSAYYVKLTVQGTYTPMFPQNPMWNGRINDRKKVALGADVMVRSE